MRDAREHTSVIPYASIETTAVLPPGPRIIEARLLWGRDTLGLRHTAIPRRGEVRVRDLGLEVPGCADAVVGSFDDAGAFRLVLPNGELVPEGCRMTLRLGRSLLRVALVADDALKLPRARPDARTALGIIGAAALHLTLLGFVAHGRTDEGASEQAARETMQHMISAAEDRAVAELAAAQEKTRVETSPGTSARTPDKEQAAAGNPSKTTDTAARLRTAHGETRTAKKPGREEVETFGILSLLAGDAHGEHAGSAFAAESGPSAMGNIFGQTIDDAAGMGGLGLSGPGQGGGGYGAGVKLASIGTIGHAGGVGVGQGFGAGAAPRPREHVPGSYTLVWGESGTQVNGRLMPESVQRVVRQNFGRLRACYEAGLKQDPGLEGRVSVKFVIDREGEVALASPSPADTTLPDASVVRCVTRAYQSMTFPKPEGGIVTVVYPVVFTRTSP